MKNVVKGEFHFNFPVFKEVSDDAKDLITKLLVKEPSKRLNSEGALSHPWIQAERDKEQKEIVINPEVYDNMKSYMENVNFKKATLTFLASRIPEEQIDSLRQAFIKLDKNGDGTLSLQELQNGASEVEKCQLRQEDLELALKLMDSNQNGVIDYTEFIAGCMQSYVYLKEKNLKSAFEYFDKVGKCFNLNLGREWLDYH